MSTSIEEHGDRGYVFQPGLLSSADVRTITDELDRILAGQPQGMVLEKDGVTLRSVFNPHRYSDVFARLTRHPRILSIVEELLGEQVYTFQLVVNNKAAFNGDLWYWHQDYPTYRADDHIAECRMVNTLIFLDEVSQFNGPLMIVPGSHRLNDIPEESDGGTSYTIRYSGPEVIREQVRRGGIVAPTGSAGSVIFMNPNALHGSNANLSPWPRRMISLTYNAMTNKATAPTRRSRDVVYDDTDLPALQALGEDCLASTQAARSEGTK